MSKLLVSNSKKSPNQEEVKNNNKKQEKHASKAKNQEEAILCQSLSDAENKVVQLLNQGSTYREITKSQFKIGDRIKRFNPSQISAISKAANTIAQSNNADVIPSDNPNQTIFKLLKKGKSLTDIVIQTGIEPEIIKTAFEQYLEFENYVLCPKGIFDEMRSQVLDEFRENVDPKYPESKIGFKEIWEDLHYYYQEFEYDLKRPRFIFPCLRCGKSTDPDEEDAAAARAYLSKNHICHQCAKE